MSFSITLATVLLMLAYSVPGYALVKSGKLPAKHIPSFANVLLYVNSPMQTMYAMQKIEFSGYMVKYLGIALLCGTVMMGGMLALCYALFRSKQERVIYRIVVASAAMGTCGFMGIPMVEALMPDYPQGVAFTSGFFLAMNILMWTAVSFIYTRDSRYISVKKIFLNPATIAMGVSLILFFGRIDLHPSVVTFINVLGTMATPLCMLILGMRLGAIPLKPMFTQPLQYLACALKLIAFPLLAYALLYFAPVERSFAQTIFIVCAMPVGNLVLSFAEILGEGQDAAANIVLLSTILSMVTVPVMMLLIN